MKHLILGSEGQIGGHLKEYLIQKNEKYYEFDIIRKNDEDLRIPNNPLLIEYLSNVDMVHFLAFDVGGSLYMKKYQDTYDFISNNIKIMNNTFDLLKKYETPFIFASSQMSNMIYSTYGLLKAIGERYTKALNGICIKFWNVYGYEKDPEKNHVITDFINMAKNENKIRMRTNGQEERQFLYADDCSECLLKIAKSYDEIDREKLLHITSFKWTKILEVGNIISKKFGNCPIIPNEEEDMVQKDARNKPDEYILTFWKPRTSLEDGISKVIEAMK